jgi:oligosaccharide translocation protein RFT1
MTSTDASGFLNAAFSSASSLMALQLFSRLFTFVLNQALFRMASPQAFGTAAIQFELLLSTILFLSREGIRGALMRTWSDNQESGEENLTRKTERTIKRANLALLPALSGIPLAAATSFLYVTFVGHDTSSQKHFELAISIYALSAVTELLSEPMHTR